MSFFKKIFGGENEQAKAPKPQGNSPEKVTLFVSTGNPTPIEKSSFPFGRYTDRNKTNEQRAKWSQAVAMFNQKNYLASHTDLMEYIKDHEINNLKYSVTGDTLNFEFIQGSNIIKGQSNPKKFEAVSNIAKMDTPSVPVMNKLMRMNLMLKYSKFALKDNFICMKFSSSLIDASPNKVYYGLQELARKADQQDDLLISEFSSITEIENESTIKTDALKQATQIKYIRQWISDTMQEINRLDKNSFSGGIAFLLLNLTYKIDYLIKPQGVLMNSLDKIHNIFFAKNEETTQQKNSKIIDIFNEISGWEDAKLKEGLYDTISTFSLVNPKDHKGVMDTIFAEIKKADWYVTNGYPKIVDSIYEYAVSYAFFTYGMHYPTMHVFDLVMNIYNPDFYKEMGIKTNYVDNQGNLNREAILSKIHHVVSASKQEFPKIDFRVQNLKFDNKRTFYHSLMTEADYLNYN